MKSGKNQRVLKMSKNRPGQLDKYMKFRDLNENEYRKRTSDPDTDNESPKKVIIDGCSIDLPVNDAYASSILGSKEQICKFAKKNPVFISNKLVTKIDKGVPYLDGSGVSPAILVAAVISEYCQEFWDHSFNDWDGIRDTILIDEKYTPEFVETADKIAEKLDTETLCGSIEEKTYSTETYREYILAYARYASEERMRDFIQAMKKRSRGQAKMRYWARTAERALLLSDTLCVANYIDEKGYLEEYAKILGYSVTEYRDLTMLPDFGFDEQGIRKFQTGEKMIRVSLSEDLSLRLFDEQKQKYIKTFPKEYAEEFKVFKKDLKSFIDARKRMLNQLYLTGDRVSLQTFKSVYLSDVVIKKFTPLLIWMDRSGKTFAVTSELKWSITTITNIHLKET